eukprot:TRINITY_DN26153_c0_g1_i1.p1 TRINITY_DN26153_c0_g1~~TRINITY_DN26153_c0_g1_i1.p1  ORF type:complete len:109 (-),score=32.85 TRINITY_DN26153_c0_g1_i1:150-476(-)
MCIRDSVQLLLLDQLEDKLAQLRPPALFDERLVLYDLVEDELDIGLGAQVKKVDRLISELLRLLVLEDNARRVVSEQEPFKLHRRPRDSPYSALILSLIHISEPTRPY